MELRGCLIYRTHVLTRRGEGIPRKTHAEGRMPCEDIDARREDDHVTIEPLNNLKTLVKMLRLTE